jgi:hypothetical protein
MVPPWLGLALRAIPWDILLKKAPAIINTASSLVGKTDTPRKQSKGPTDEAEPQLSDVKLRLETLEEHDRSNAEVVKQIADQLEIVTKSLEVVSARVQVAILIAGLTFVIGLVAFGFILFN